MPYWRSPVKSGKKLGIGIDIIFFGAEDYGTPEFVTDYTPDSWCLGTQFWAKNPHVPNYTAEYGILLDMVGGKNATFFKEQQSLRAAAPIVEMVWSAARDLGYGKYFINATGGALIDDHQYVISGRNIPVSTSLTTTLSLKQVSSVIGILKKIIWRI